MDFFIQDPASSPACESTPRTGQEESLMTEDTGNHLLRGKSLSGSMTELQEQHSSSSIDVISRRVQELIENMNNNRASDQKVMDSFQEKLVAKVMETCLQMKEHMCTVYEENGNEMQVKLQELSDVLQSCTKLNDELLEANRALASLREGLAIIHTSES